MDQEHHLPQLNGDYSHKKVIREAQEKKAIRAASRSIEEWIASEIILTEPIANPTTNFMRTRPELDMTEILAVLSLRWSRDSLSIVEICMGFLSTYQHPIPSRYSDYRGGNVYSRWFSKNMCAFFLIKMRKDSIFINTNEHF